MKWDNISKWLVDYLQHPNFKKEILPGESVIVNIEFDSLFKDGKQTKAVTFFTNDPNNPIVDVVVIADVTGHHLRK